MRLRSTLAAAAAAGLLTLSAAPAFAVGGTYEVKLHQPLPLLAATGAEHEAVCDGIGPDQDGWHFVLRGNSTDFVKLTVTFEPGGQQVITKFGPPNDKHAFVGSAPGAKLTAAVAEVKGGDEEVFNLSHTCLATATVKPSPSTSTKTSSPSSSPSVSASGSTSPVVTPSASVSPSAGASVVATKSPAATPSASSSATVAGAGGDSLAFTGSTGTFAIAGVGALLVAGGGALMFVRSRRAHRA